MGMTTRTAYMAHDGEYRRRRAKEYPGWDEAESVAQTLKVTDAFLADVNLPAKMHVLEFGCGAGDLLLPWAARGHWICGVDIF
jgi:cyclopropane fatty-acyl-phospholipid synthase-like methyltransferase